MGAVTARKRGNKWEYRFEGLSVSNKRKQFSKSGFLTKKEALDAGNKAYNEYRNTCCCTILSYIEEHPEDIKAINEYLVMACKNNILREGEFDYGNQYVVEKYYLFPEYYAKNK